MDSDIRELQHAVRELAFGLDEALQADLALDQGNKARYEELNERARQRVKKLQIRLGLGAAGIPHMRSAPQQEG